MTRGALLQRERRPIPLDRIAGRSPANCRKVPPAGGDDIAALAASMLALHRATGEPLIQPLIVGAVPGPLVAWHVHDGGRRCEALKLLAKAGDLKPDHAVDCLVLEGDDEAIALEVSLFANTMRRDLHPVEQCDAFAALQEAGLEPERIAADFALTVRMVKQRLRLTVLSPRVRDAWRDGRMTLDQAQAFAIGQSHEAQDELLERIVATLPRHAPANIRTELLHAAKALPFDTREARFLGLGAYVAAGGRIAEDLFADAPLIFDEPLLKRLSREKMMRAGQAILEAEGYGFCYALEDVAAPCTWKRIEPEFTAVERDRLEAIEDEGQAIVDDDGAAQADFARLDAEENEIQARGFGRAATPERRAKAGILVAINHEGRLDVERGVFEPDDRRAAAEPPLREPDRPATKSDAAPKPAKPADPVEAAAGGLGQVRAILDETVGKALVDVVSARPDLALMYAVARFGGTFASDALEREFGIAPENYGVGKPSKRDGLLGRLDAKRFDAAIDLCADVALGDLTVAFAAIAARSIRLQRNATLSGFAPIARAFARRGAALGPAFRKHFNADRYFEAASAAACRAALAAMNTPAVDKSAKKPALAALAAAEAGKHGWLPYPLDGWAKVEAETPEAHDEVAAPSAEAPSDAIDGDELRREIEALTFLTSNVVEWPGAITEAATLYAAFDKWASSKGRGEIDLGDVLFELGFESELYLGSKAYRGISLSAGGDA